MKKFLFCPVAFLIGLNILFAGDDLRIASVQYWIDDDLTNSATVSDTLGFEVDCSALSSGLHTLHYRVADSEGHYSRLHEHSFFKIPKINKPTEVVTLQYWWDDSHENAVSGPYTSEEFTLSTDALPMGLHSLKYRVKDNVGRWSECKSHYFYKGEVTDSAKIVKYSYWWNDLKNDMTVTKLETPASTFILDEDLTVPENARTNFAGHYTATLNVSFIDNHGKIIMLSADVKYPDNEAPSTDIDADAYFGSASTGVRISWKDLLDDEMGDYNVYVSKDNGPFYLWRPDTKELNAIFKGESGSTYRFTVTGRDAFGNRENYDESKCVSVTFE